MNLNLGVLCDSLEIPCQFVCGDPDSVPNLSGVYPYVSDVRTNAPNFMYIMQWGELQTINKPPRNVACVGGGETARDFFTSKKISGLIFHDDRQTLKVLRDLQEIFAKYNALEINLISALLNHESIHDVLNACGRFFSCHVMLFGSNFQLLEHSDNFMPPENDEVWRETKTMGRSVVPMISREKIKMTPSKPSESPRSMFINCPPLPPHINIAFDRGDLRIATMIFYESGAKISEHALWIVDFVAEMIQPVIIERYNLAFGARNHLRTSFVAALQYANMNSSLLRSNIAIIGWGMKDNYRIILVSLPPESRKVSDYLYNYENLFADSFTDIIAMHYNDFILILMHGAGCEAFERSRTVFERQLNLDGASAAVGKIFCGLSELKVQYDLAILAMHMRTDDSPVCMYNDIVANYIVGELSSCFPIHAACHHAAIRIYEYDIENGTDLLLTLETYLINNKSLKDAANDLFVHRNTVTYRLARIENIVQMDLENPRERFSILLSCIALRILNAGKKPED